MRLCVTLPVVIAALPVLAGPAHAQANKGPSYYAKSGVTPARYHTDLMACVAEAKKTYDAEVAKINVPYQPGLGGAAATGLITGWKRGKLKREGLANTGACMEKKKGYRRVWFTPAQLEIWNQLNTEQRDKALGIVAGGGNIARAMSN